jgi:uncharacterized protein
MGTNRLPLAAIPEARLAPETPNDLLLQIRSDRRLGHEWDDWDGAQLPADGAFEAPAGFFFRLAGGAAVGLAALAMLFVWLLAPRLAQLWVPLPGYLAGAVAMALLVVVAWLIAVGTGVYSGVNRLPGPLGERGVLPWLMPKLEGLAMRVGFSRDRVGNSLVRVHNRLSLARIRSRSRADDLLILLPRCLDKASMRAAMEVSSRYGVPLFVASRGRYARQMIALRRPEAVVAVACERDLVAGIHQAGRHLPVLGATLRLPEGPCKNAQVSAEALERHVRALLGLPT